jgi:Fic family protein
MSPQIQSERSRYYRILEQTQRGNGDITEWLEWFLACLERILAASRTFFHIQLTI